MGKSIAFSALVAAILSTAANAAAPQERQPFAPNEPEVSSATTSGPEAYLGTPFPRPISECAAAALERFGPWAKERGYVGHLSPDQSVLFFSLARRSAGSELRWIERVEKRFGELLPNPRSRTHRPITGTGGPTTRVYPIGGHLPIWKHDLEPVDSHCGVLFELDRDVHFDELCKLVDLEASRHLGEPQRSFLTRDVGAWIWRVGSVPDAHQLVHGAAQFVLERRFPHLPEWLRDGLAWHVEEDVLGSVRCLPESRGESSRDFAMEWNVEERVRPFQGTWVERLAALQDWRRGPRHVDLAGQAYVFVGALLECDATSLSNAADELRLYWEDHAVRHDATHGWQRLPNYRTPLHVQGRVLAPLLDAPRLARTNAVARTVAGE